MKKVIFLLTLLVFNAIALAQQDAQFTQKFSTRLAQNPAYAGINGSISSLALYRSQWVGFSGHPQTSLLTLDSPINKKKNMGMGLTTKTENAGYMNNFYSKIAYSYHFNLGTKGAKLGLGLELGINKNRINGNWVSPDGGNGSFVNQKSTSYDMGLGAFYNVPNLFFAGIAVSHLPLSNKFGYYHLARHYNITAGYDYKINQIFVFKSSIFVISDAASTALDINLLLMYNKLVWAGVSYRFKDAIAPMIGVQFPIGSNIFKLGYSYDITTSAIKTYSSGSHEITLGYGFSKKPKKAPKTD